MRARGVTVDLISRNKLDELSSSEKIDFIIGEVKKGKILILEKGLTASEQADLIKKTMSSIDHDTFIGIEVEGYPEERLGFLQRLLGIRKPRLTVIGPANLLKTVKKDDKIIEAIIVPGRGV